MNTHGLTSILGGLLFVSVSACGGQDAREAYSPTIDAAVFVVGVDNPFFPLVPGTTFVYETPDGKERVETFVTRETKEILGVTCTVVRNREIEDGELVEDTFDWYAQDESGNVWYFGEETREYENGEIVSTAGSWEAGTDGAQPGIMMKADPQVGDSYRQEYLEGVAEDMGEVISLDESVVVSYGSFDGTVMTRDWTPLEPSVEERKYYARGVGLLLEVEGDGEEHRVQLVAVTTATPAGN